ncbi:MAG: DUF2339 domain-containing protein [Phycisphaerales bacterium]|nr:DUF2339 domain-containing protein [Phycisphaerales bacterium]
MTFIVLIALGASITALVVAVRARDRSQGLEAQLGRIEREVARIARTTSTASAPPTEPAAFAPAPIAARGIEAKIDTLRGLMRDGVPAHEMAPDEGAGPGTPTRLETLDETESTRMSPVGAPVPLPTPLTPPSTPAALRRPTLEEQIGARLPVYLGSIALFLAVAFLVKYTFDKGLLTPVARVMLGAGFGLALLGAGEWWRRSAARIAQGVTAAGVAALFASCLAAVNLYHLVGRTTGFGLLAGTTALAVLLSLRQGAFVALLGLIGGFLTPALIGSQEPQPGPLFTYLFLLQCGLHVVSRKRNWWPLSGLTLICGLIWAGVWMAMSYRPADSAWVAPFLMGSVATFVWNTRSPRSGPAGDAPDGAVIFSIFGAAAGMTMLAVLVGVSGFAPMDWAFLGVLGAGAMVLARRDARYEPFAWLAASVGAAVLLAWHFQSEAVEVRVFAWTAGSYGLLYGGGAYAAAWGARRPSNWSIFSVTASLVYLLTAHIALRTTPPPVIGWGGLCALAAAAYAGGTVPVYRRRTDWAQGEKALAALCTGVSVLVSLGAWMEWKHEWIAVSWSAQIVALVLVGARLSVPILRMLAMVMGIAAVARLIQPGVLGYPISESLVFNWIGYGCGLPALCFLYAAWFQRLRGDRVFSEWLYAGSVLSVFLLVTLEARHVFHPQVMDHESVLFREWVAYVNAWLALALPLLLIARRWPLASLKVAGRIVAVLAGLSGVLTLLLRFNPLWAHESMGATPVANLLLLVYGLPALLMAWVAKLLQREGDAPAARLAGGWTLLFVFVLITLQVRQGFHGDFLDGRTTTNAEWYAYSAAWIVLGTLLLVLGILTRGLVLRWASLIVMLAAVGKVFLSDTSHLRDLYRVVSFLGLGASLLLLAFLYQRFVFARADRSDG